MGRKPKARRDSYGAWLHHLRTERGLSQDELAARIRIPQSTLAYWERTGKLPGREVILRLSEELGISVTTLLRAAK
jgi:transcriptional regulator with XRE-family HTH domain